MRTVLALAACAALLLSTGASAADSADELQVNTRSEGGVFLVDAELRVPVSPRKAWAVLTDFDHMSEFVHAVKSSHVVSRQGNRITVAQKGDYGFGLFSFESVREIEMAPLDSIKSHSLSGTLGRLDSLTRLKPDGGGTHIVYHATAAPEQSVPLIGSALIRNEVRAQFESMRDEMLRREAGASSTLPSNRHAKNSTRKRSPQRA